MMQFLSGERNSSVLGFSIDGQEHLDFRIDHIHDPKLYLPTIISIDYDHKGYRFSEKYMLTRDGMIDSGLGKIFSEDFTSYKAIVEPKGLIIRSETISNILSISRIDKPFSDMGIVDELKKDTFKHNYKRYMLDYSVR